MNDRHFSLLLLPIDVLRSHLIPQLTWKEQARLDEALNNRTMREKFNMSLCTSRQEFWLRATTTVDQLRWLTTKGVIISTLVAYSCIDDFSWLQFAALKLVVDEVDIYLDDSSGLKNAMTFLASLRGITSIAASFKGGLRDDSVWDAVLVQQPHLRNLRFNCVGSRLRVLSNTCAATMVVNCLHLESIVLLRCANWCDQSVVLIAQHCHNLTDLQLTGCEEFTDLSLTALADNCLSLQWLRLSAHRGGFADAGLAHLLQRCKIRELHLWDCSGIADRSMTAIAMLRPQLTELSLDRCNALGSMVAERAMLGLCNLTILSLARATDVSENLLVGLIENNPNLELIDLKGAATVTNAVLAAVASKCPDLASLDVSYCTEVSDLRPIEKCAILCVLHVSGCPNVTDSSLLQLAAMLEAREFELAVYAKGSGVTDAARLALLRSPLTIFNINVSDW